MEYTIKMYEKYGDILNIRSRAESIFDDLPSDACEVIIDFQKVEFIGHSFTQEYYRQIEKHKHFKIVEINKNYEVTTMINVVFGNPRHL